jgi:hypothetical protein
MYADINYSWTTKQLKSLTEIENHKIMFDGYEYIWMINLDGNWSRHSFQNFETYGKAVNHLRFHMYLWDKELHKRKHKKKRKDFFKEMKEHVKSQEKIYKMAKSTLPTIEKINFIRLENPYTTKEQMCELLGIKKRMYYRHLKNLKKRGTLFSA